MKIKKTLPWFLNLVIFAFVLLLLFLQSSTASPLYQTNTVRTRLIATNIEVSRFGNEAASVGMVEDSAREVPTGPDPLHHNNHPVDP